VCIDVLIFEAFCRGDVLYVRHSNGQTGLYLDMLLTKIPHSARWKEERGEGGGRWAEGKN
jgi:hypothetical protein